MNSEILYIFADSASSSITNAWVERTHWITLELNDEVLRTYSAWLILPVKKCSIFQVQLPKIQKKDIRKVIQSILEDSLLQDFSELWWSYEKTNSDYLVYIWDKKYIEEVQVFWQEKGLRILGFSLDWFALSENEIWLEEGAGAYMYTKTAKGFLPDSLFSNWSKTQTSNEMVYSKKTHRVHPSWQHWVLHRLKQKPMRNIFAKYRHFDVNDYLNIIELKRWFPKVILSALGLSLTVFFGVLSYQYVLIHQNKHQLQHYPGISTKHLEEQLNRYQHLEFEKNKFWVLWIGLQKTTQALEIKNMNYDQNKMHIELLAKDLQSLQTFKKRLSLRRIRVEQLQAQTFRDGVRAVLDLQGGL